MHHYEDDNLNEIAPLAHRPREAAKRVGVCVSRLYQLVNAGEIVALKDGRSTLIPEASLRKWLDSRAARQPGHWPAVRSSLPPRRAPTSRNLK